MEGNIKITILNQELTITLQDILQLKPLVKEQSLKMIQVPYFYKKFTPDIDVFNSCLYYLIVVDKNIDRMKEHNFREICAEKMTSYYISNHMNFQLYEYGILAAKILSYSLDKTLHILYFLVYGRLASKPYINNMIYLTQKKNIELRKRHRVKPDIQNSRHKSIDSRHFTVFCESNQYEADQFKRQLKKVFTSPNTVEIKKNVKKMQNKRYFNLKKIYPDEFQERYQSAKEQTESQYRNLVSSIPLKVSANQNSSIITKIKGLHYKKSNKSGNIKKIQVRKQKFNDNISEYDKFYEQLLKADLQKERKEVQAIRNHNTEKDNKQNNQASNKYHKFPYDYYKNIVGKIKDKNQELDLVRNECTHHNTARNTPDSHAPFSFSKINQFSILKTQYQTKTSNLMEDYKKQEENQFFNGLNLQDFGKSFLGHALNMKSGNKGFKMNKQKANTIVPTINSQANGLTQSSKGQNVSYATITRKNDKFYQDIDETGCMQFNKSLKSKFKLQKYKRQYKQFLKTQLFEKSKELQ